MGRHCYPYICFSTKMFDFIGRMHSFNWFVDTSICDLVLYLPVGAKDDVDPAFHVLTLALNNHVTYKEKLIPLSYVFFNQ